MDDIPEYDNLDVTVDANVGWLTLDSTAGRNALTATMTEELVDVASRLGENSSVRCIALTHSGNFFGAGADLTQFEGDARDAPELRSLASRLHDAIVQFHQAETPIVGAVDGVAAGAGFSLALMPDLLLVSDQARLEYAYPRIGLTGDGGATFYLPRLVGLRAAKEIVLRDEPIGPEEAVDLGLANSVVSSADIEERLRSLTADLAKGPTRALGMTTRLLDESFDRGIEAQLAAETENMAAAANTDDFSRGVTAFFSDDEPEFTGE